MEDLLTKCREAEDVQWQAQQYCSSPTQSRPVQESRFSYRRVSNSRTVHMRAQNAGDSAIPESSKVEICSTESSPKKCFNSQQTGHCELIVLNQENLFVSSAVPLDILLEISLTVQKPFLREVRR